VQLPALVDDLKSLVEPHTSGSPMQPLLWASRSLANLAGALKEKGHAVSTYVVRGLLKSQNYSLQANRKTHEGSDHPDRDSQFHTLPSRERNTWRRAIRYFPSTEKRKN
jgi:hypothetical protein